MQQNHHLADRCPTFRQDLVLHRLLSLAQFCRPALTLALHTALHQSSDCVRECSSWSRLGWSLSNRVRAAAIMEPGENFK